MSEKKKREAIQEEKQEKRLKKKQEKKNNQKLKKQKKQEIKRKEKEREEKDEKRQKSNENKDSPKTKFEFIEITGDLFTSTESLAHCVSADLSLSKGIATIFKKKFGGIEEMRLQNPQVGDFCHLKQDDRFIIALVTKQRYFHKPTYETLSSSLEKMKDFLIKNSVTRLSIPKIASGLDRLNWNTVSSIIKDIFKDTDIVITVYHFPQKKKF
ncbi:hypothetical protein M0811_14429 [Anaeramoeba ignava]|uniref:Macro domain-containing protein n=1 Tax=Anaeramoeba ignava TaxID=1746090 RepID=A0A9Q0LX88_ANAIG|nr:hypothetical protein M0811_14429 [Anaeramoeba ignava]